MRSKRINTILSILLLGILAISCAPSPEAGSEQVNSETSSEVSSEEAVVEETTEEVVEETAEETSSGGLNVTVSIVPQKYFVERVGGDHVTVNIMVEPGNSPATYEPQASQMTALSEADLYFSIGVPFEKSWMDKIEVANSEMTIVDLSANLEKMPMTSIKNAASGEIDEKEGILDPHVWLSPENAKVMSETIYETLAEADPEYEGEYQANLDAFLQDIDDLEVSIKSALEGIQSNQFMVFHPAWGYFARDFGLEQLAIEIEGSEPSAQELASIINEAKEEKIQVIFGQPEFSTKTVEYIAEEINGQVILISPLVENWLENLQNVANTFAEVLK